MPSSIAPSNIKLAVCLLLLFWIVACILFILAGVYYTPNETYVAFGGCIAFGIVSFIIAEYIAFRLFGRPVIGALGCLVYEIVGCCRSDGWCGPAGCCRPDCCNKSKFSDNAENVDNDGEQD
jgi:hypothetical protein